MGDPHHIQAAFLISQAHLFQIKSRQQAPRPPRGKATVFFSHKNHQEQTGCGMSVYGEEITSL